MPYDSDSPVTTKVEAGAPEALREHGHSLASLPGESKFPPEDDVIGKPVINLTQKVVEIMRGYKTGPNYFIPVEVSGLDN